MRSFKLRRRVAGLVPGLLLSLVSGVALANPQHAYIPDDTHIYVGVDGAVTIDELMAISPMFALPEELKEQLKSDQSGEEILENLADPQAFLEQWGVDTTVRLSVYTVGLSPVVRLALSDSSAFRKALDDLQAEENASDVSVTKIGDMEVRTYPLPVDAADTETEKADETAGSAATEASDAADKPAVADAQPDKPEPAIVIASNNADAVLTVLFDVNDTAPLEAALGHVKPAKSVADTGKLKDMRKKWGYNDVTHAFFDFEQIVSTVVDSDSGSAKQLMDLMETLSGPVASLEQLRSEPCRTELKQIAANWPQFVSGYRSYSVSDNVLEAESHGVLVINHQQLRDTLSLFRGVVPVSQSASKPMLSVGLGLTVDNLAQAIGQLNQLFASMRYECPSLAQLNAMSQVDTSAAAMGVAMFGGLARGVQGLSVNVFDAELDSPVGGQPIKSADVAIALAADEPAMLLQTLRMVPPLSPLADIPVDGTETVLNSYLPVPIPGDLEIKAAIKGKNIVLFAGEMGSDYANRLGGNGKEGLLDVVFDGRLMMDKVIETMDMLGQQSEDADEVIDMMSAYVEGLFDYSMDFTESGIELLSGAVMELPDSAADE